MLLWVKAFHVIFMVTWFAALFYLPRLFVYHAMTEDQASIDRFKIMERKLYRGIMTPGMALTIVFGIWLLILGGSAYFVGYWLWLKLIIVALLIIYHLKCGKILKEFSADQNTRSHVWFRWFNEAPVFGLIAIVILVVVKPI